MHDIRFAVPGHVHIRPVACACGLHGFGIIGDGSEGSRVTACRNTSLVSLKTDRRWMKWTELSVRMDIETCCVATLKESVRYTEWFNWASRFRMQDASRLTNSWYYSIRCFLLLWLDMFAQEPRVSASILAFQDVSLQMIMVVNISAIASSNLIVCCTVQSLCSLHLHGFVYIRADVYQEGAVYCGSRSTVVNTETQGRHHFCICRSHHWRPFVVFEASKDARWRWQHREIHIRRKHWSEVKLNIPFTNPKVGDPFFTG